MLLREHSPGCPAAPVPRWKKALLLAQHGPLVYETPHPHPLLFLSPPPTPFILPGRPPARRKLAMNKLKTKTSRFFSETPSADEQAAGWTGGEAVFDAGIGVVLTVRKKSKSCRILRALFRCGQTPVNLSMLGSLSCSLVEVELAHLLTRLGAESFLSFKRAGEEVPPVPPVPPVLLEGEKVRGGGALGGGPEAKGFFGVKNKSKLIPPFISSFPISAFVEILFASGLGGVVFGLRATTRRGGRCSGGMDG